MAFFNFPSPPQEATTTTTTMLDEWLAGFTFSRSVRHVSRDFSDAVLMAELLAQLLPAGAVGLHNYPSTGRYQQKLINWDILNRKVLTPIGCELSRQQMEELAGASPGAIPVLLVRVKQQTDPKPSPRAMGKPPRSPTKQASPTSKEREGTPSLMMRAARAISKQQSCPLTSAGIHKTSGCRSPTATSNVAVLRSPPKSAPTSPRKTIPSELPASPTRSEYSLLDYLPLPGDRPTIESLPSTFSRVLQMTDYRVGLSSKRPTVDAASPRAIRSPPSPQSPKKSRSHDSDAQPWSKMQIRPQPAQPVLRAIIADGSVFGPTKHLPDAGDQPAEDCNADAIEGSFAFFNSRCRSADTGDENSQLARIVQRLASDEYLVQLFKPSTSKKVATPSTPHPRAFASTPHFIQCYQWQLEPVRGVRFDPVASVWITEHLGSRARAWSTGSNSPKAASPLSSYTTKILSRHKLSVVDVHSPVELRTVESATESASQQTPGSPDESSPIGIEAQDLCPQPTVFPPVSVDVSTILDTLPVLYSPASKKARQ